MWPRKVKSRQKHHLQPLSSTDLELTQRSKEWKHLLSEGVFEGADVFVGIRIREFKFSSVPVQNLSDPLSILLQTEISHFTAWSAR